ncbi:hypothetical protein H7Y21_02835 [Arenimonas sp.]|nr:hypothetical protein [Candidatus Parcubacteria bacterium]
MNLFSISNIILSLSSLFFGLIVYHSNKENPLIKYWLMFAWCFSFWSLGLFGVTYYTNYSTAFFWQYVLDFFAVFLPSTYVIFLIKFFKFKNKFWMPAIYISSAFFAIFSFTPYFKTGISIQNGLYWIVPGKYYLLFIAYFMIYAIVSIWILLFQLIKNRHDPLLRGQIRNIMIASLFGYGGGSTNFLPYLFKSFPYGNYFVIFFLVFMVYGVLKYKILNTKVISAQIFSISIILISLFNFLRAIDIQDQLINLFTLVLISFFSYFLIRSVNGEVKAKDQIQTLADNLTKSNDKLEDANVHLKELDQKKSEFMSLATHQLRAPLTAMRGYYSMIQEGTFGKINNPEIEDVINKISRSTTDLTMIVEDYLNISRIEQGKMQYNFNTLDIADIVNDVVKEVSPTVRHAGLTLNLTYDNTKKYMVSVDQGKIKQVVFNIIDNSIKYTPKGSITVSIKKTTNKKVLISVKDTGVGIKSGVIPQLFQKFTRAPDASETNILGTGLGLYVADQILKAHHGGAWAESEGQGKGSQFYIELNLSE